MKGNRFFLAIAVCLLFFCDCSFGYRVILNTSASLSDEFIAGTSAINSDSLSRIESVARVGNDKLKLEWNTAYEKSYAPWGCTNLVSGGWELLEGFVQSTPLVNQLEVDTVSGEVQFFNMKVGE